MPAKIERFTTSAALEQHTDKLYEGIKTKETKQWVTDTLQLRNKMGWFWRKLSAILLCCNPLQHVRTNNIAKNILLECQHYESNKLLTNKVIENYINILNKLDEYTTHNDKKKYHKVIEDTCTALKLLKVGEENAQTEDGKPKVPPPPAPPPPPGPKVSQNNQEQNIVKDEIQLSAVHSDILFDTTTLGAFKKAQEAMGPIITKFCQKVRGIFAAKEQAALEESCKDELAEALKKVEEECEANGATQANKKILLKEAREKVLEEAKKKAAAEDKKSLVLTLEDEKEIKRNTGSAENKYKLLMHLYTLVRHLPSSKQNLDTIVEYLLSESIAKLTNLSIEVVQFAWYQNRNKTLNELIKDEFILINKERYGDLKDGIKAELAAATGFTDKTVEALWFTHTKPIPEILKAGKVVIKPQKLTVYRQNKEMTIEVNYKNYSADADEMPILENAALAKSKEEDSLAKIEATAQAELATWQASAVEPTEEEINRQLNSFRDQAKTHFIEKAIIELKDQSKELYKKSREDHYKNFHGDAIQYLVNETGLSQDIITQAYQHKDSKKKTLCQLILEKSGKKVDFAAIEEKVIQEKFGNAGFGPSIASLANKLRLNEDVLKGLQASKGNVPFCQALSKDYHPGALDYKAKIANQAIELIKDITGCSATKAKIYWGTLTCMTESEIAKLAFPNNKAEDGKDLTDAEVAECIKASHLVHTGQ